MRGSPGKLQHKMSTQALHRIFDTGYFSSAMHCGADQVGLVWTTTLLGKLMEPRNQDMKQKPRTETSLRYL